MTDTLPIIGAYLALILSPFAILALAILAYYIMAVARCVRDRCWQWR